ncbi:hypothetical protein Tdes44962_MAKER09724 [Teratosphaeria destructans]|uniref:Uncharacterized protein n=1 Tax=Teratosphaeria destructans TaxID=418781 RepID=A0A9W7W205_9PEZI|nr:hypothetical protein Tdes44962_MAKER09724 [Teratosphaeria destructans]
MTKSKKSHKQPKTAVQHREAHAKKGKAPPVAPVTTPEPKQKHKQEKPAQLSKKAKKPAKPKTGPGSSRGDEASTTRVKLEQPAEEWTAHMHVNPVRQPQYDHVQLALSYMIVDGPHHPLHARHAQSVLDAIHDAPEQAAHLDKVLAVLRSMGEQLRMPEEALEAEREIREAVLRSQGERLARDAQDESALLPGPTGRQGHGGMGPDLVYPAPSQPLTRYATNDYDNLLDRDFLAASHQQARSRTNPAEQRVRETRSGQEKVDREATPKFEGLLKAARGVDALFSLPDLLNLRHEDTRRLVAALFESPEDLFLANVLALSENRHHGDGREFDLPSTTSRRSKSTSLRLYLHDFQRVQQGNFKRLAFPSVWNLQQSPFARTRRPLVNMLQRSAKPTATDPLVAADHDTGIGFAGNASSGRGGYYHEDEGEDSDQASENDSDASSDFSVPSV